MNGINIKLLKLFVKNDTEYTSTTICNSLNITNIDEVENSLEELLELGLIKIAHKDILYTSYKLTPTGRDYFKNKFKIKFDKYIFPIISSIISFVLGLISGLLLN